jgi:hypothetical protein
MRLNQRIIKRISDQQERRTAKDFSRGKGDGRNRPGSGNKDHAKGDAITGRSEAGKLNADDFLIENKFTFETFYTVKMDTWNKIANEALRENMRTPILQVDIAKGTPAEVHLVLMDYNDFLGFDLSNYFPDVHELNDVTSRSFRLHALKYHIHEQRTLRFRADFCIHGKSPETLVLLHLADFKHFLANS